MTDPTPLIRTLCPHLAGVDLGRAIAGARDDISAAARLRDWLAARHPKG